MHYIPYSDFTVASSGSLSRFSLSVFHPQSPRNLRQLLGVFPLRPVRLPSPYLRDVALRPSFTIHQDSPPNDQSCQQGTPTSSSSARSVRPTLSVLPSQDGSLTDPQNIQFNAAALCRFLRVSRPRLVRLLRSNLFRMLWPILTRVSLP